MEQNVGNETLEEQNAGVVEAVDTNAIEQVQLNDEVEKFFADRLNDPEMDAAEQRLAQMAELEAEDNAYEDLSEIFERMKAEDKNKDKQGLKLLAGALDLAEVAKGAGIEFKFSYEDFDNYKRLLLIAHKEYEAGQLSDKDFIVSVKLFVRFIEFVVYMQDEPNELYIRGLDKKVTHVIKTGDLSVLNF